MERRRGMGFGSRGERGKGFLKGGKGEVMWVWRLVSGEVEGVSGERDGLGMVSGEEWVGDGWERERMEKGGVVRGMMGEVGVGREKGGGRGGGGGGGR